MERIISNKFNARMSTHAINDVMNAKLIMHQLRDDKMPKSQKEQLVAMLHKHIVGWS